MDFFILEGSGNGMATSNRVKPRVLLYIICIFLQTYRSTYNTHRCCIMSNEWCSLSTGGLHIVRTKIQRRREKKTVVMACALLFIAAVGC
jgi:hypothetical protein